MQQRRMLVEVERNSCPEIRVLLKDFFLISEV